MTMNQDNTTIVLIGFQNDYFSRDGILTKVIEESSNITGILQNTMRLLEAVAPTRTQLVSTPIHFSADYSELDEPVGILKTIKDVGAFKVGTKGSETIPELVKFGRRVQEVPGKRGLNAFSNTDLEAVLRKHETHHVVLAGTVTSICIDSTGRAAQERGFKVSVLSDCTSSRTNAEQDFYCQMVFPLYAEVITSATVLKRLGVGHTRPSVAPPPG